MYRVVYRGGLYFPVRVHERRLVKLVELPVFSGRGRGHHELGVWISRQRRRDGLYHFVEVFYERGLVKAYAFGGEASARGGVVREAEYAGSVGEVYVVVPGDVVYPAAGHLLHGLGEQDAFPYYLGGGPGARRDAEAEPVFPRKRLIRQESGDGKRFPYLPRRKPYTPLLLGKKETALVWIEEV